ncbi:hypothetical protein GQ600_16154 [Phytophthora cactorum]|nr:hypothetical protein GQ600_16154 [Phytophthora cactorum]
MEEKLRKAFGASASTKEATSKSLGDPGGRPRHPRGSSVLLRLSVEPIAMLLALPTLRPISNSHMVTTRSTSRMRRMDAEDEGSRGRRGGARASRNGLGRRQTNTGASSRMMTTYCVPHTKTKTLKPRQMREIAALNDFRPYTED